jgi:predicted nucleic acid-binding protein
MSGRFFLDTNVFVYAFDQNAPQKSKAALALIRRALDTGQGVISYQVAQEFVNVAVRRFEHPFSIPECEQYFLTVLKPLLAIHSSPVLYLEGLRIMGRHRMGWYDSLIVAGALESQCATLYSEDMQSGREIDGLRIENPFIPSVESRG